MKHRFLKQIIIKELPFLNNFTCSDPSHNHIPDSVNTPKTHNKFLKDYEMTGYEGECKNCGTPHSQLIQYLPGGPNWVKDEDADNFEIGNGRDKGDYFSAYNLKEGSLYNPTPTPRTYWDLDNQASIDGQSTMPDDDPEMVCTNCYKKYNEKITIITVKVGLIHLEIILAQEIKRKLQQFGIKCTMTIM